MKLAGRPIIAAFGIQREKKRYSAFFSVAFVSQENCSILAHSYSEDILRLNIFQIINTLSHSTKLNDVYMNTNYLILLITSQVWHQMFPIH